MISADSRPGVTAAWMLIIAALLSGCGIAASYRSADIPTIRDFDAGSHYRKTVGVVSLRNTSRFVSEQAADPFMQAFVGSLVAETDHATLVLPGAPDAPPFLSQPPLVAGGEIEVFGLSRQASQAGMNVVVSPVLMDIRVRERHTGIWIFRDTDYGLQIQTAAALYDVATGARLDLKILTDEVEIDAYDAEIIRRGEEIQVDDLVSMAEKMGTKLGRRMGDAINDSRWVASVVANAEGAGVIAAGSQVGVAAGDRFAVLDASAVIVGRDRQRFIVPGPQLGEITITRVGDRESRGAPESGEPPPVGSIVIPLQ